MIYKTISLEEVKKLVSENRVVHLYPRRRQVAVDGWRYYPAGSEVIKFLKKKKHDTRTN